MLSQKSDIPRLKDCVRAYVVHARVEIRAVTAAWQTGLDSSKARKPAGLVRIRHARHKTRLWHVGRETRNKILYYVMSTS